MATPLSRSYSTWRSRSLTPVLEPADPVVKIPALEIRGECSDEVLGEVGYVSGFPRGTLAEPASDSWFKERPSPQKLKSFRPCAPKPNDAAFPWPSSLMKF